MVEKNRRATQTEIRALKNRLTKTTRNRSKAATRAREILEGPVVPFDEGDMSNEVDEDVTVLAGVHSSSVDTIAETDEEYGDGSDWREAHEGSEAVTEELRRVSNELDELRAWRETALVEHEELKREYREVEARAKQLKLAARALLNTKPGEWKIEVDGDLFHQLDVVVAQKLELAESQESARTSMGDHTSDVCPAKLGELLERRIRTLEMCLVVVYLELEKGPPLPSVGDVRSLYDALDKGKHVRLVPIQLNAPASNDLSLSFEVGES